MLESGVQLESTRKSKILASYSQLTGFGGGGGETKTRERKKDLRKVQYLAPFTVKKCTAAVRILTLGRFKRRNWRKKDTDTGLAKHARRGNFSENVGRQKSAPEIGRIRNGERCGSLRLNHFDSLERPSGVSKEGDVDRGWKGGGQEVQDLR